MFHYITLFAFVLTGLSANAIQVKNSLFEKVTVTGSLLTPAYHEPDFSKLFTIESFKEQNVRHLEELFLESPNLNFSGATKRARFIQIRGIGERSQYGSIPKSSIGVFLDHIDLTGFAGVLKPVSINNVHLLKGPSSQFHGSSSIGGSLIAESHPLDLRDKTSATLEVGNYKSSQVSASHQKQFESFNFKASALHEQGQGLYKNTHTNSSTNKKNELSLNLSSDIYLNKKLTLKVRSHHFNFKNGYDVWSPTSYSFITTSDHPGRDDQNITGASTELNYHLSPYKILSFITSFTFADTLYSYDEDWGNNEDWNNVPGWLSDYNYFSRYIQKTSRLHQKAIYKFLMSKSTSLTTGLHYYQNRFSSNVNSYKNNSIKDYLISENVSKNLALIGSLKHRHSKKLSLRLSLRTEHQDLNYQDSKNFNNSTSGTLYSWSAQVNTNPTTRDSLAFKFSKGFNGKGFNPDPNLSSELKTFDSEELYHAEVSYKKNERLFSGGFNLFYFNRKNQQIQTSVQLDPLNPSSFITYTDNVSASDAFGSELNMTLFPHSTLSWRLNLGLLKSRFKSKNLIPENLKSRDTAQSPRFSFNTGVKYKITPKTSVNINVSGKSSFYFSHGHNFKSKKYMLTNMDITHQLNKKISLRLWGKNLFDKRYATKGFYFANEPPNWDEKLYLQSGRPIEVGLLVNVKL